VIELVALVALILAVYAAILSTGLIIWVVSTRRRPNGVTNVQADIKPEPPRTAILPGAEERLGQYGFALHTTATPSGVPIIILLDEQIDTLLALHRILIQLAPKNDIVLAKSAAEALAILSLRPVQLVITGYKLEGGMDGMKFTDAIKEMSPSTRVIMTTMYVTPETEKLAYAHRADYFLPKPFPISQLEGILRDIGIKVRA